MEEDCSTIDRSRLMKVLSAYFEANAIEGDWEAIEQTGDERLVTSLAMICPLGAPEKQALLESMTLTERAEALTAIMEIATHGRDKSEEHTSELQSLMRISYAVFCLKQKKR